MGACTPETGGLTLKWVDGWIKWEKLTGSASHTQGAPINPITQLSHVRPWISISSPELISRDERIVSCFGVFSARTLRARDSKQPEINNRGGGARTPTGRVLSCLSGATVWSSNWGCSRKRAAEALAILEPGASRLPDHWLREPGEKWFRRDSWTHG